MRLPTLALIALIAPATAHASAPRHAYAPSSAQAEPVCPKGDQPVWVNTKTSIYHYRGMRWYGQTKYGKYACEKDALAEGNRATRNGK